MGWSDLKPVSMSWAAVEAWPERNPVSDATALATLYRDHALQGVLIEGRADRFSASSDVTLHVCGVCTLVVGASISG